MFRKSGVNYMKNNSLIIDNNLSVRKQSEPLISIIIPVYKVERYIHKCIDSVLNQSYHNIEIILVDDGSPDKCPEICDQYAINDCRVKVIHLANSGQSAARNIALDIIKGNYVCFIDSDDYVSEDFIYKLYRRIIEDNSDIVMCDYFSVDLYGNELEKKDFTENKTIYEDEFWQMELTHYYMHCVALWNKMFKRNLWSSLRLKVGKYAEDNFAMIHYIPAAKRISVLNEKLYFYIQRKDSAVHNYSIKNLDRVEADFERCEYFATKSMLDNIKNTLLGTVSLLVNAYSKLDLSIDSNKKRYNELRNQYKHIYRNAFNSIELNKRWFYCTLYYVSDSLSFITSRIISVIKR